MIDIKLIRTNPELVKENIRKKFQDEKLELVDKVVELDKKYRETKDGVTASEISVRLKASRLAVSWLRGQKDEAEKVKAEVTEIGAKLTEMEELEVKLEADIREIMLVYPNIIDESVPLGKDDQ